jgi:hypothetical protein
LDYVIPLVFEPLFAWNELGQYRLWLYIGSDSGCSEGDKGCDEKLHDYGKRKLRDNDMMARLQYEKEVQKEREVVQIYESRGESPYSHSPYQADAKTMLLHP